MGAEESLSGLNDTLADVRDDDFVEVFFSVLEDSGGTLAWDNSEEFLAAPKDTLADVRDD